MPHGGVEVPLWVGYVVPTVAAVTAMTAAGKWMWGAVRSALVDIVNRELAAVLKSQDDKHGERFRTIDKKLDESQEARLALVQRVGELDANIQYIKGRIDRRTPNFPSSTPP